MRGATREGLGLVAAGCFPFAVGALATRDGVEFMPPCPFRTLTGLPCPLCGGTRAFAWAARGDSGFLHYNAFWVLIAVLMVLAGAVVLLRGRGFLDALMRNPAPRGDHAVLTRWARLGLRARRARDHRPADLAPLVAARDGGDDEEDADDGERDADPAQDDARRGEPAAAQVAVGRVDLALGLVAVDDRQRTADQRADDERADPEDERRGGRTGRRRSPTATAAAGCPIAAAAAGPIGPAAAAATTADPAAVAATTAGLTGAARAGRPTAVAAIAAAATVAVAARPPARWYS